MIILSCNKHIKKSSNIYFICCYWIINTSWYTTESSFMKYCVNP